MAKIPWVRIRVLSPQQRLLAAPADSAVYTCEKETEDASNLAHLSWGARILLQPLLDKVTSLCLQLFPWGELDLASVQRTCNGMVHAEETSVIAQINLS